jgi:hypothetical protein
MPASLFRRRRVSSTSHFVTRTDAAALSRAVRAPPSSTSGDADSVDAFRLSFFSALSSRFSTRRCSRWNFWRVSLPRFFKIAALK